MGRFRPAGLGESEKALVGALERASITCGVGVQKGAFDFRRIVHSRHLPR